MSFLQHYSSILWLSLCLMAQVYKSSPLTPTNGCCNPNTPPAARSIQNWITFSLEWTETTSVRHFQTQVWLLCSHLLKELLWGENTPGFHSNWINTANAAPFSCVYLSFWPMKVFYEYVFRPMCPLDNFLLFFSFISIQWGTMPNQKAPNRYKWTEKCLTLHFIGKKFTPNGPFPLHTDCTDSTLLAFFGPLSGQSCG